MKYLLCLCFISSMVMFGRAVQADWQTLLEPDIYSKGPVHTSPSFTSLVAQGYSPHQGEQCGLYKVGFTQDLYFEYIQYKAHVPEMKEFTLCYWNKYINHSADHPLFSYAVDGQPRAILAWVSNTERSSYYSLSIEGHTFYRLNYPLRLNRWYHTCQSWNGKTGEWQIWVNAERVGRGFHNRLVGHSIPAGGVAITGQEQTQTAGGFSEEKGYGGMLGEITMVQLYSVALTAGKAHRDHKHHHAHEYDHNGVLLTTTPTPPPNPRPTQPTHPLLTGGQLNPNVALNLAAQQAQQQQQQQQQQLQQQQQQLLDSGFGAQLSNGQFASSLNFQFPGTGQQGPQTFRPPLQQPPLPQQQQIQILPTDLSNSIAQQQVQFRPSPLINSGLVHPSLINPANVQIVDTTKFETHQLFKRQSTSTKAKRESEPSDSKHKKRELILTNGQLLDDSLLTSGYDQSLLAGLAGVGQNEPVLQRQKLMEEREPAEAEVTAVMNICSGCDEEPFGKALVFGWRTVPKKLYSGAYYFPAVPQCRVF